MVNCQRYIWTEAEIRSLSQSVVIYGEREPTEIIPCQLQIAIAPVFIQIAGHSLLHLRGTSAL